MRQRVLGEALQIIPQTVEVPREMPEQAPNGGHGAQHGEALRGEMIVQDLAQHPIRRGFLAIVDFRYPPARLRWGEAPRRYAPGVLGLRCHCACTPMLSSRCARRHPVTPLLPWCEAPSTTRAVVRPSEACLPPSMMDRLQNFQWTCCRIPGVMDLDTGGQRGVQLLRGPLRRFRQRRLVHAQGCALGDAGEWRTDQERVVGWGRLCERHAINRHGLFSFSALKDVGHCPRRTALLWRGRRPHCAPVSRAMPAMTAGLSVILTTPQHPRQAARSCCSCAPGFPSNL